MAYDWISTSTSVATVNGSGFVTSTGAGQTQIKAKIRLPRSMIFGYCPPGPYFARGKSTEEKCDERSPNPEVKDTQAVTFSNIAFKMESKRNTPLRPVDCDCITTSPDTPLAGGLTVIPKVTINVPPTAKDGDTTTFSVTVQGGNPTSYQWSFTAPSGAGNDPQVNFSNPTASSTTAPAHWFALPNAPCVTNPSPTHPYYNSKYTIKVTVSYSGGETTKEKDFTVNNYWEPDAGHTSEPTLSGDPAIAFNGITLKWYVAGPGTLQRNLSQAVYILPSTSQFYNKIVQHEQKHEQQWASGIASDLWTVSSFMNSIQSLTHPTQSGLLDSISFQRTFWVSQQQSAHIALFSQMEREAYDISDPLNPQYAYQNCGRY